MKALLGIFMISLAYQIIEADERLNRQKRLNNPLKMLGKCISDHECEPQEYCDHNGINPIGSCKLGYPDNAKCHFDRHCKSKYCHHYKCIGKKPVRDGKCNKDQHQECPIEQYCKEIGKLSYYCRDKKCSGFCFFFKHQKCLSNSCLFFWCRSAPTTMITEIPDGFCSK